MKRTLMCTVLREKTAKYIGNVRAFRGYENFSRYPRKRTTPSCNWSNDVV